MSLPPSNRIPDDEIDVRSIGKKILSFVAYIVSLLFSNIKTTIAFIVAAVLLAVSLKYIIPRTYKSSFIIRPNDKHEKFHVKILGDIKNLLKNQDFKTLASELHLSDSAARSIANITIVSPTYKATADSANYTEITLELTNYNQFIPIQNSIINYLENNPFFSRVRSLQEKIIDVETKEVNKDLPRLDSLKNLQLSSYGKQQVTTQNSLLLSDLVNPTSFYAMSIERGNKRSGLIARRMYLNNFELIKSCVVIKIHDWPPRILVMIIYLMPFFLIICLLFLHFKRQMQIAQTAH